jgi:hypothetical protein
MTVFPSAQKRMRIDVEWWSVTTLNPGEPESRDQCTNCPEAETFLLTARICAEDEYVLSPRQTVERMKLARAFAQDI